MTYDGCPEFAAWENPEDWSETQTPETMLLHKGKLYEEKDELQEQLPLESTEAQEEFEFAEANPDLLEKLKSISPRESQTTTEERKWKRVTVE